MEYGVTEVGNELAGSEVDRWVRYVTWHSALGVLRDGHRFSVFSFFLLRGMPLLLGAN